MQVSPINHLNNQTSFKQLPKHLASKVLAEATGSEAKYLMQELYDANVSTINTCIAGALQDLKKILKPDDLRETMAESFLQNQRRANLKSAQQRSTEIIRTLNENSDVKFSEIIKKPSPIDFIMQKIHETGTSAKNTFEDILAAFKTTLKERNKIDVSVQKLDDVPTTQPYTTFGDISLN